MKKQKNFMKPLRGIMAFLYSAGYRFISPTVNEIKMDSRRNASCFCKSGNSAQPGFPGN
ncbi:MAG: hypothetical protein K8S00_01930 [Bacteroidales bacterium]|nr:hypothetical protein [Bacteroidales bacterium]